ncbi:hypothetical protein PVAP13_2KG429100 [Panicum virgatum]|uniref:Uncharacterized protein n=1 Tax=Panicum virgatum TaxID=38727 RepID=A0A8T0WE97_PANVG|nr:hypothetical protein PVAP13_2KG429100 [Panicum virgatum]
MDFFHAVRGKASSFFLKKKYSRKHNPLLHEIVALFGWDKKRWAGSPAVRLPSTSQTLVTRPTHQPSVFYPSRTGVVVMKDIFVLFFSFFYQ